MSAVVMIADDGQCHVEMRATSRELFGHFSASMDIDFINAHGQNIFSVQTPAISTTNLLGICLRGKLSHDFTVDPTIVKQTDKIRLTSGKEKIPASEA